MGVSPLAVGLGRMNGGCQWFNFARLRAPFELRHAHTPSDRVVTCGVAMVPFKQSFIMIGKEGEGTD